MKVFSQTKPRLGISACLLGQKVRFDGGHKREPFLTELFGKFVEWMPICPEVEVGMSVPRETVRLVGTLNHPRMIAEKSGQDWTETMNDFAAKRMRDIAEKQLSGYVFKKNSPSCGMERVKVYNSKGMAERKGRGLFAAAIMQHWPLLPVEEEGRLNDLKLRENFIERVFAYHRWQHANSERSSAGALVRFHTSHKFLLLAHSVRHYRQLGRLVAAAKQRSLAAVYDDYGRVFMEALAVHATEKTHANVLDHMMGYFSKQVTATERQELVQLIGDFRRQLIPLIAPITMIRHYTRKYQVAYLQGQLYLEPNPKELMLRNHV
ncbi:MAG: YbgA family protein [Candidatus Binatia bacterium]